MNIQTTQVTAVTITMTEDDARAILVDPTAFQDQLRAVLAQSRDGRAYRKGTLSLGGDHALPAGSIERAARKQNKRFLVRRSGTGKQKMHPTKTPCPLCDKKVTDTLRAWRAHYGQKHPGVPVTPALAAVEPSLA